MHRFLTTLIAGLLLFAASSSHAADPPAFATPWTSEHHARVRLIAGGPAVDSPRGTIAAGIEIELADGWKTYWRNPGSSGVPPQIDWASSSNLASADLRFPAPTRYADRGGDIIGYKHRLILPVAVQPADPKRDVALTLDVEYGVCKDICIPVQARLELTLPPGAAEQPPASELVQAFDRVPRPLAVRRVTDPKLHKAKVVLDGPAPMIRLDALFPGGTERADVFVEAPAGLWVPMAKREGPRSDDTATFIVDLNDGADIASLKGKSLRITLVSPHGQSETTLKLD